MGTSIEEYRKMVWQEAGEETKDIKRQIQGKINHELGQNFENQIETICEMYKLKNIAIIEKTPEPMKILKHTGNGHFEAIFTKSAQPDFKGIIKGGRTVVFDAKFTEKDRITYQALSDFQRDALLNYNKLGAVSFVLVGFMNRNIYKIPINDWAKMKQNFGRKYIKQDELEVLGYRIKSNNGIIDFLGGEYGN